MEILVIKKFQGDAHEIELGGVGVWGFGGFGGDIHLSMKSPG